MRPLTGQAVRGVSSKVFHDATQTAVITAGKEVDPYTAPYLREALIDAATTMAARRIVVDLSGCKFIDATGLAVLVGALKRAREHGCGFALAGPDERLTRVLRITGLDKVFAVYPDTDQALAALTGAGSGG